MAKVNGKRIKKMIAMALAVCCLVVMGVPVSGFAASRPATPKNVEIVTDRNGDAASGIRVFAQYDKVKGVDGYQIKSVITYRKGSDGFGPIVSDTKTINTKKTKRLLSKNEDYKKATVKVRSYKICDGEKVYSKWSKEKTKKL